MLLIARLDGNEQSDLQDRDLGLFHYIKKLQIHNITMRHKIIKTT